jgi:hypothetical protein
MLYHLFINKNNDLLVDNKPDVKDYILLCSIQANTQSELVFKFFVNLNLVLLVDSPKEEFVQKLTDLKYAVEIFKHNLREQLQCECSTVITQDNWLKYNTEALASVKRGLTQAESEEGVYLGSFAKYVDLEIDD